MARQRTILCPQSPGCFFLGLFIRLLLLGLGLGGLLLPTGTWAAEPETFPEEDPGSIGVLSIRLYQKLLSPVMASECYMAPSCSRYAQEAFSEYGPFLGLLLTIDRFFREADEHQTSPLIREGRTWKLYDPPVRNVWWKQNRSSEIRRRDWPTLSPP